MSVGGSVGAVVNRACAYLDEGPHERVGVISWGREVFCIMPASLKRRHQRFIVHRKGRGRSGLTNTTPYALGSSLRWTISSW